jgi:hypothetical protein
MSFGRSKGRHLAWWPSSFLRRSSYSQALGSFGSGPFSLLANLALNSSRMQIRRLAPVRQFGIAWRAHVNPVSETVEAHEKISLPLRYLRQTPNVP